MVEPWTAWKQGLGEGVFGSGVGERCSHNVVECLGDALVGVAACLGFDRRPESISGADREHPPS